MTSPPNTQNVSDSDSTFDESLWRDLLLEKNTQLEQKENLLDEKDQVIGKKTQVIQSQKARIAVLEELLRQQKQKRYGRSSEQQPNQLGMFDEAEAIEVEQEADDEPKKKKPSGRKGLNPTIPRVQHRIELSDEAKDGAIDTYFVKVKEELDIIPAQVQVIELMQEKAIFIDDEDKNIGGENKRRIVSAPLPKHPLPKAVASTNTLAYIIIAKYMDALPLYRLEGILGRYGGSVTRTTLANWLIRLSLQLAPLIKLMREHQWNGDLIQADETRVQVLKEPGRSATSDKWMWLTRGGPPDQPSVLFEYDPSRSKEVPLRLLEGFNGALQTDGYAGYNAVVKKQKLQHAGCWDHARRKFDEAEKAASKDLKANAKSRAPSKARMGLSLINKLYLVERQIQGKTAEEKIQTRQQESIPLLNTLKTWLEKNESRVSKEGLTWKAISYTLNQWEKLTLYCEQGEIPISNILAENAIRPFCVGRRNWLFSDTPKGANASAIYYSLIETAKANGLEPYGYFKDMLKELPYAETMEDLEKLLPWNFKCKDVKTP